jgi:predicted short-subunit dehydrogenase-like oxidoreductase (DUF2520 family)
MNQSLNSTVALVGPGRVGQALGHLLAQAGVNVRFVAARRATAARRAARFIGAGRPVALSDDALSTADVLLLTVSDAALESVVERLATLRADWRGRVVLHTSGSVPSSVLQPFRRRGAAVGSLHLFQTVPNPATGVRNLVGCFWGLEGDRAALKVAARWVRALKGTALRLRPESKTLYHVAAFLTCPAVVTLMDRSERLLRQAGIPARNARAMLVPFVAGTAANFGALGGRGALTGPAVRRDWLTFERHLAELRRHATDVVPVYEELVRAMLRLAGTSTAKFDRLRRRAQTAR